MQLLTKEEVETTSQSFLIECQEKGLPLVISFGFYDANNNPQFDFYRRLKKIETLSGRALNKLLLRDPEQLWYLSGIRDLGDTVASTVIALKRIIADLAPSSIATIGQSMGGYAAILYGVLLGADKVISFGSLSAFDATLWNKIGDRRWLPQLQLLAASGAHIEPYHDLVTLMRSGGGSLPSIDLVYGTHSGGESFHAAEAVGLDVVHAMRFADLANVTLLPIHAAPHAVVEHLRSRGVITDLLLQRLFGRSLETCIQRLRETSSWSVWAHENLMLGCSESQLYAVMLEHGITGKEARANIEHALLIQALAEISDPIPSWLG